MSRRILCQEGSVPSKMSGKIVSSLVQKGKNKELSDKKDGAGIMKSDSWHLASGHKKDKELEAKGLGKHHQKKDTRRLGESFEP